ncbi:MAG: accessory gene regulator B family protein [Eubacteriales bacterium]|nr:accessory gene regulator B family protein [Eubacteriales bacterium]
MEKLVRRLASKIAKSQGYDAEKEAVVAYGLLAIVQVGTIVVLALIFGFLVGAPVEAMIVCFSVSILRKYSGGAHAYDADFCTIMSVIYCALAALASRLLAPAYNSLVVLLIAVLGYGLTFWIAYRYVPVDSPNKPIKSEAKIKRMRKGSMITITVYAALQLFLFLLTGRFPAFRSYGISLLMGTGWQALTLTPLGSILLDKLNDIPKYLRKET